MIKNNVDINDLLKKNCMDYSVYTILDRAIPSLADGLKPIHRKILFSMFINKLFYDRNRIKSASACGNVLKFSPHGDASVYQAMVRLANDSVLYPLIDGKGAFSSITTRDVPAGASRYTEVRLSKISNNFFKGIEKKNVDFKLNYDNTIEEPTYLPVQFPLILCNANIGIAVGIASSIPSFNILDVIKNTINVIDNKPLELMYPDFKTGGYVIKNDNIAKEILENGKGSYILKAKYRIEDNHIIITEIPYTTTREAIIEKIIKLAKEKGINDIVDVNDYTGVHGLEINIELKKKSNAELIMQYLFKNTPLQDTFSCNLTMIDLDNRPKCLGIKTILEQWLNFRRQTIRKELDYDIIVLKNNIEILKGLKKIFNNLSDVIDIFVKSEDEKIIINILKQKFNLSSAQIDYITKIKLINLNKNWVKNKIELEKKFKQDLFEKEKLYNDDNLINDIIKKELENIGKEFGHKRYTKVIEDIVTEVPKIEKQKEQSDYYLVITKDFYIKKLKKETDNIKLKANDEIIIQGSYKSNSVVLVFTDKLNCYKIWLEDIALDDNKNFGIYLPVFLKLDNENVLSVQVIEDKNNYKDNYLINVYKNNMISKIDLNSFYTKNKQTKLKNSLANSDLVYQSICKNNTIIVFLANKSRILSLDLQEINTKKSRNTQGLQVFKEKTLLIEEVFEPEDFKTIYNKDANDYLNKRGSAGKKFN